MAPPLTLADLTAALDAIGGFEPHPLVVVAVSGGPDSLALAILADRWARRRGGAAWGVTVDHGLRPESAAEAYTVAGWLAARGIPHAILTWLGDKPRSGIQEAARMARYRLLADWCAAHGVLHLLTAHHREDQAETHRMRRCAGSGVDGLAAMSAVRELPGCRLVRPLLGVAKARLAAFLAAEGQDFLRDPSNRDLRFERARLRTAEGGGADPATLAEIRACGRERIRREETLSDLLGRAVSLHPAGFGVLDPGPLYRVDAELAERLLGRLAATIGGGAYPLRRARLARLRAGLAADPGRPRTLGGCRFVPWRGRVLVLRELGRAAPPQAVVPGESIVWDRRFVLAWPMSEPSPVTLGYLGVAGVAELGPDVAPMNPDLPRLAYPVLPALRDAEGILAVPALYHQRDRKGALAPIPFRPPIALAPIGFTVV